MKPGTKILNIKSNDTHIVDVCETYGDTSIVFTTDSKCFNTNDVRCLSDDELISQKLMSLITTTKMDDWEY